MGGYPVIRKLEVYADGTPFVPDMRCRLTGKNRIGLYPSLFILDCWNLGDSDVLRLSRAKRLEVFRGESCLASGTVSDVYSRAAEKGTVTSAAFSMGLDLWQARISYTAEAGATVSETVSGLLAASGTGIRLLSFPGENPARSRGQAFFGRAAECVTSALSAASAEGVLVEAGLKIVPKDPLPATMTLTAQDLLHEPMRVDGGRKLVLATQITGFQPGDEILLAYGLETIRGLILERAVEADTVEGPWKTELLVRTRVSS